jgi:NADH:ubiquinone oxidoreductase subunit H
MTSFNKNLVKCVKKIKLNKYIFTHFNKLVVESYMTGNCHVWFGGRRNQLSTPTFDYGMVLSDLNVGILYLFAISSLGVYGIIAAGWSSNSKYVFLGALRSAAQMVFDEVSIRLIIITVLICVGSCNFSEIVIAQKKIWFGIPLFLVFIMFFISCLAETNQAPFDLLEAEAELVTGYNVEYSSMGFVISFLGEYANMILMRCGALHLTFIRL